jgi:hypothetical protein
VKFDKKAILSAFIINALQNCVALRGANVLCELTCLYYRFMLD